MKSARARNFLVSDHEVEGPSHFTPALTGFGSAIFDPA